MDPVTLIEELKRMPMPKMKDVYVRHTFECWRDDAIGNPQKVMVHIFDAGPGAFPEMRYHCRAELEDGTYAMGNPAESPETALAIVHWNDLG
jgi:hypothetical protein